MPCKDLEKNREYQREWRKKNPDYAYERNIKRKLLYRKKHPNVKHYDSYHDYETHHQLAMSSGIRTQKEWFECFQQGLMPDGIYQNPNKVFRR